MVKHRLLLEAASKVLETCVGWWVADGVFPEPEYENFVSAICDLKEVLREHYGIVIDTDGDE
jgi:hypothetical protein